MAIHSAVVISAVGAGGGIDRFREVMSSFESYSTGHPPCPDDLAGCHVPVGVLEELLLKHLHPRGSASPSELARELRLPLPVTGELLAGLQRDLCVEGASEPSEISPEQGLISLTQRGRRRACDAFDASRYLGPAPVSVADYTEQCLRQRWDGSGIAREEITAALSGVTLSDETLAELQWAMTTGGSLLLTGQSGNGKSLLANRLGQMIEQSSEEIAVPYSLWVEGTIVRVFDPLVHHPLDRGELNPLSAPEIDGRWRRIRRPVIRVGAELTRESFDIRRSESGGTLAVPFQVQANGGMLIVDDLGRQVGSFAELMNRWLLPLEEQRDAVQWPNGRRQNLPVDAWVVLLSGDDAPELPAPVARRVRCRIELPAPDRERFATLLFEEGRRHQIEVDEAGVEELFTHCYNPHNPPKCSDPQNLLQAVESICRIQKETVRARADLLMSAARRLGLDGEQRAA